MKRIVLLLSFLSVVFLSCQPEQPRPLRIAVAANMQFAMDSLAKKFTDQTGISYELVISSSGKLTAQIKEGAPYDVFVSADMDYPQHLYETGFTVNKPEVYADGKLVLWTTKNNLKASIELLTSDAIAHVAVANPKTAPYGKAAMAVIRHYGLEETLKNKLVYAESITQTNQFVTSGAAEAGFTAKAVVLSPQIKGQGNWIEIDQALYPAIEQGIVLLKKEEVSEAAQAFYRFIFSDEAREVLKDFGYSVRE
jgi:molybdate transport system substrate-binding protein